MGGTCVWILSCSRITKNVMFWILFVVSKTLADQSAVNDQQNVQHQNQPLNRTQNQDQQPLETSHSVKLPSNGMCILVGKKIEKLTVPKKKTFNTLWTIHDVHNYVRFLNAPKSIHISGTISQFYFRALKMYKLETFQNQRASCFATFCGFSFCIFLVRENQILESCRRYTSTPFFGGGEGCWATRLQESGVRFRNAAFFCGPFRFEREKKNYHLWIRSLVAKRSCPIML